MSEKQTQKKMTEAEHMRDSLNFFDANTSNARLHCAYNNGDGVHVGDRVCLATDIHNPFGIVESAAGGFNVRVKVGNVIHECNSLDLLLYKGSKLNESTFASAMAGDNRNSMEHRPVKSAMKEPSIEKNPQFEWREPPAFPVNVKAGDIIALKDRPDKPIGMVIFEQIVRTGSDDDAKCPGYYELKMDFYDSEAISESIEIAPGNNLRFFFESGKWTTPVSIVKYEMRSGSPANNPNVKVHIRESIEPAWRAGDRFKVNVGPPFPDASGVVLEVKPNELNIKFDDETVTEYIDHEGKTRRKDNYSMLDSILQLDLVRDIGTKPENRMDSNIGAWIPKESWHYLKNQEQMNADYQDMVNASNAKSSDSMGLFREGANANLNDADKKVLENLGTNENGDQILEWTGSNLPEVREMLGENVASIHDNGASLTVTRSFSKTYEPGESIELWDPSGARRALGLTR